MGASHGDAVDSLVRAPNIFAVDHVAGIVERGGCPVMVDYGSRTGRVDKRVAIVVKIGIERPHVEGRSGFEVVVRASAEAVTCTAVLISPKILTVNIGEVVAIEGPDGLRGLQVVDAPFVMVVGGAKQYA